MDLPKDPRNWSLPHSQHASNTFQNPSAFQQNSSLVSQIPITWTPSISPKDIDLASRLPACPLECQSQEKTSSAPADTGIYTCTQHGCTLLFDTIFEMKHHRRIRHPNPCYKTNPWTGKRCDLKFSRPHDLTRHVNSIHKVSKEKEKCELCTDRGFSRHDALVRHMGSAHPEHKTGAKKRKTKCV
ncbi:hypothetical protein HYALB_00009815 [Hymenoscyphus albidus]|uniref:C2H2-type domain-containing protein n=1 Tax=Hymenoscyphus albidus TaxID=595503 RepID=A0A9N9PZ89_9HELO|nr:hypothetical protein HYALB_00009815 [Hymenoscyphus albidus]